MLQQLEETEARLANTAKDTKADKERIMTSKVFCIHKVRVSSIRDREICLAPYLS